MSSMAPESLTRDQINYAVWRYLQENGFYEAACKLQRDWLATNPEELPFAKYVKENALLNLVQKGLEWFDVESRLPAETTTGQTRLRLEYPFGNPALRIDPTSQLELTGQGGHEGRGSAARDFHGAAPHGPPGTSAHNSFRTDPNNMQATHRSQQFDFPHPPSPPRSADMDLEPYRYIWVQDAGTDARPLPVIIDLKAHCTMLTSTDSTVTYCWSAMRLTSKLCEWNPNDSNCLATVCRNTQPRIFHAIQPRSDESPNPDIPPVFDVKTQDAPEDGQTYWVVSAATWDTTGHYLAVAYFDKWGSSTDSYIHIYEKHNCGLVQNIQTLGTGIPNLSWNPSGSILVGILDNLKADRVFLWDRRGSKLIGQKVFDYKLDEAVWINDTDFIVVGSDGLELFRFMNNEIESLMKYDHFPGSTIATLKYDSVLGVFAVLCNNSVLSLYDINAPKAIHEKREFHKAAVVPLAWQPTNKTSAWYAANPQEPRLFATACTDRNVRVWNARAPYQFVHEFTVGDWRSQTLALAFSPDGTLLAAACDTGLDIYNVNTHISDKRPLAIWRRQGGNEHTRICDPDGKIGEEEARYEADGTLGETFKQKAAIIWAGGDNFDPHLSWSGDGSKLAHSHGQETAVFSMAAVWARLHSGSD